MFALSWRNVWRQRGRSLVTAGAVGIAVYFTLVFLGLIGAMENGMYDNLTEATGQMQVHIAGYRDQREFRKLLIPDASAVRSRLEQADPSLKAEVAAALEVPALLSGEVRSRGVALIGQDQPPALRASFTRQYLSAGHLPEAGDLEGIALGAALARALNLKLGDTVYAYAPGTDGRGAGAYRLVGLLTLSDSAAESKTAFVSLGAAQELAAPGAATRLELHLPGFVRLSDDARLPALERSLAARLGPGLSLESWREVNPSISQVIDLLTPLTLGFTVIFFGLAGLLVVNTIYLSLLERTREFGVIVALGANGARVTRMVLLESLMLCGAGALVGGLLGVGTIAAFAGGLHTESMPASVKLMNLPPVFYPSLTPWDVILCLAFALLTGLLAAWWPARVAARLEPVEAMRFVTE